MSENVRTAARSDASKAPSVRGPEAPRPPPAYDLSPAAVNASLQGGNPLPRTTRERMEASFGRYFADVRVHADAKGASVTDRHAAEALTVGHNVAFAPGRYRPGTTTGDHLIAHELAHVVQQSGGGGHAAAQARSLGSLPSDPAEVAADRAADAVISGRPAGLSLSGLSTRGRIMRRARLGFSSTLPLPVPSIGGIGRAPNGATSTRFPPAPQAQESAEPVEDIAAKEGEQKPTAAEATAEHPALAGKGGEEPSPARIEREQPEGEPVTQALDVPVEGKIAEAPALEEVEGEEPTGEAAKAIEEVPKAETPPVGAGADLGRGAAAAKAAAALDRLNSKLTRVSTLSAGSVQFGRTPEESSPDPVTFRAGTNKRRRAEAAATRFLSRNAAMVAQVGTMGQTAAPRIGAVAKQAKAQNDAAVAANQAAIMSQVDTAMAQSTTGASAAKATIVAEQGAGIARVEAATETARARIDTVKTSAEKRIGPLENTQRDRIERHYREGDQGFRQTGRDVGTDGMKIARKRARDWLGERNGESSILDGPIHDNRLEAKADAATKVGEEYEKGLGEAADDQADKSQAGKPKDLAAVDKAGEGSRATLNTQLDAAHRGLDSAEERSRKATQRMTRTMLGSVARNLDSALAALSTQLNQQVDGLAAYGQQQNQAIDRDADLALASLVDGASQAAEGLAEPLAAFVASSLGTEAPEEAALQQVLGDLQPMMADLVGTIIGQLGTGIQASELGVAGGGKATAASIQAMGAAGVAQASRTAEGHATGAEALLDEVIRLLGHVVTSHGETAGRSADTAVDGFDQVTLGIDTLFQTIAANLETGFAESAKGLDKGLRDELPKESETIGVEAQKAADEVQPRWKTVLKVLLVIVVIIVVALVIGPAVIGAVGAAATALGAGAAAGTIGAIVGGAIVGAAAGATIQLGNNVIDGKENLLEGVGEAAIVGAISGALGGAGSAFSGAARFAGEGARQIIVRGGIDLAFDVAGGIIADLSVGREITLEGVLTGAAIGLGVSPAGANLGRFGRGGRAAQGIQARSFAAGARVGGRAGRAAAGAIGIRPRPEVEGAPPRPPAEVEAEAPALRPEAEAPRIEEPTAPKIEEPEAEVPRIEEPEAPKVEEPEAPKVEEPEAEAPRAEEPTAPKVEEPEAPKVEEPKAPKIEEPEAEAPRIEEDTGPQPDSPEGPSDVAEFIGKPVTEGSPPGYAKPYRNKKGRWVVPRKPGRTDLPKLTVDTDGNIKLDVPEATGVPRTKPLPGPDDPRFEAWEQHRWGDSSNRPCFPAGTLIKTPQGAKRIETIRKGDAVYAYDFDQKQAVIAKADRRDRNWTLQLVVVQTDQGEIASTVAHLYWVPSEDQWLAACDLRAGMTLLILEGETIEIHSVETVPAQESTYTFTVPDYHNYFVGETGILVHNESSFADTTEVDTGIYRIVDADGNVVYIGQTQRDFDVRFDEHISEPNSALRTAIDEGRLLDPSNPEHKAILDSPDFPDSLRDVFNVQEVEPHKPRTAFEVAVLEQHHMDAARARGEPITNRVNAISEEKYQRFKRLHNPC